MIHSSEKIVKNTAIFVLAMVGQKIISFFYFFYLSSRFGPEKMGAWVWALSYSALFGVLSDLGLASILSREAARHEDRAARLLNATLFIKIPLLIFTIILGSILLYFSHRSHEVVLLVFITFLVLTMDAFIVTFYAIPRAMQNLRYESLGVFIFQIIDLVCGVILWETTKSINWVIGSLALAGFFNLVYSYLIIKKKFGINLKLVYDKESIFHMLRVLPAFAVAGIFTKLYNSADSVLLGYLSTEANVGLYSIPAKVTTALQSLIPGVFVASIYPSMSNFYYHARERLNSLFEKSFIYMFLISLPMGVGLALLADKIILHIWPEYQAVITSFIIMAAALPFVFLAYPTGNLLNASDRQKITTINRIIITSINIILNIILIPSFGVLGSAIAFAVTNVVVLALDLIFVPRVIQFSGWPLFFIMLKISVSAAIMGLVIKLLANSMNYLLLILLAVIVYCVLIIILRVIRKDDLNFILRVLKSKKVEPQPESDKILN